jgi:hypothetical protein
VPPKNSNETEPAPRRTREAWIFALAVAVAGAVTGALYSGLVGVAQRTAQLSLRPYVDLSWINAVTGWMAPAFASPLSGAVTLGITAGALVLLCDAILRRAFLAPKPGAAALAAVIVLVSPGWGTMLRIEGHWGVLAGAAIAAVACLLVLEARGVLWGVGCALGVFAAAVHPVWAGMIVAVPVLATSCRGGSSKTAGLFASVGLLLLLRETKLDTGLLPMGERAWFAARDLAAAPVLAFSPNRRFDVPTGYEALVWGWPVIVGIAVHALLLGIGMMIGGVRRGVAAAATAAIGVFCAALLVPGWIPGDRAFALAAMLPHVPLVALVLGAVPQKLAKAVIPGLVLGAAVIAAFLAHDRAPGWTALGAAMDLPRRQVGASGSLLAIEAEPDPARLVLFVHQSTLRDAYAPIVVDAADKRLDAVAPAFFPERLKGSLDKLMNRVGKPRRTDELSRLYKKVIDELKIAENLWAQSAEQNLDVVAQSLLQLTPEALELAITWKGEPEGRGGAQSYLRMARTVIPVAGRAGYYEYSIPLLEAINDIGPRSNETEATIAFQRVYSGDRERGGEELRGLLTKLDAKSPFATLARGVLGIARLEDGDAAGALKELQAAWTKLGLGGVPGVLMTFTPDQLDYYVVAEILLARYEAAKAVDPGLATQAARDLADLLDPALRFGVRRLPALALMGRLELLRGNRDQALLLLRESRRIPSRSLEDRSDGPIGRVAHPRYRRIALESLLAALRDDPDAAAERAEIEAELRQLATH